MNNSAPYGNCDQERDTGQGSSVPVQESDMERTNTIIKGSPRFLAIMTELVARAEEVTDLKEDKESQNRTEVFRAAYFMFRNFAALPGGKGYDAFCKMLKAPNKKETPSTKHTAHPNKKKVVYSELLQESGRILMSNDEELKMIEGIHFRTILPLLLFEKEYMKLGIFLYKNSEESDTAEQEFRRARVLSALYNVGKQYLLKPEAGFVESVLSWEISNSNEYWFIERNYSVFKFSLNENSGKAVQIPEEEEEVEGTPEFKVLPPKKFHFLVLFFKLPYISLPRFELKSFQLWRQWVLRVDRFRNSSQENCVICQTPLNHLATIYKELCPYEKEPLKHCWECFEYKTPFLNFMAKSLRNYLSTTQRYLKDMRNEFAEESEIIEKEGGSTSSNVDQFDRSDSPSTSSNNLARHAIDHASSSSSNFEYVEQYDDPSEEHYDQEEQRSIHHDVSETVSNDHHQADVKKLEESKTKEKSDSVVTTDHLHMQHNKNRGVKRNLHGDGSNSKKEKIPKKKLKIDDIANHLLFTSKEKLQVDKQKSNGIKCNTAEEHPKTLVLPDATGSESPGATKEIKDGSKKMDNLPISPQIQSDKKHPGEEMEVRSKHCPGPKNDLLLEQLDLESDADIGTPEKTSGDVMETCATKEDNMSPTLDNIGKESLESVNIDQIIPIQSKSIEEDVKKEDELMDPSAHLEHFIRESKTECDDGNEEEKMEVDEAPHSQHQSSSDRTNGMHPDGSSLFVDEETLIHESESEKIEKQNRKIDFYQITNVSSPKFDVKDREDNVNGSESAHGNLEKESSESVNVNKSIPIQSESIKEDYREEDKLMNLSAHPVHSILESKTGSDDGNEEEKMEVDDAPPSEHHSSSDSTNGMHPNGKLIVDEEMLIEKSESEKIKKQNRKIEFDQITNVPSQKIDIKDKGNNANHLNSVHGNVGKESTLSENIDEHSSVGFKSTVENDGNDGITTNTTVLSEHLIRKSETITDGKNKEGNMDIDDAVVFPSDRNSLNKKDSRDFSKTEKMHQEENKLTVDESKFEKCEKEEGDIDQLMDVPNQEMKQKADNEVEKKEDSMNTVAHTEHPDGSKSEYKEKEKETVEVDKITDVLNQNTNLKEETSSLDSKNENDLEDACKDELGNEKINSLPDFEGNNLEKIDSLMEIDEDMPEKLEEKSGETGADELNKTNDVAAVSKSSEKSPVHRFEELQTPSPAPIEVMDNTSTEDALPIEEDLNPNSHHKATSVTDAEKINSIVKKSENESGNSSNEKNEVNNIIGDTLDASVQNIGNVACDHNSNKNEEETNNQVDEAETQSDQNDQKAPSVNDIDNLDGLDITSVKGNGTTESNESKVTSPMIVLNHNPETPNSGPISSPSSGVSVVRCTTPVAPIVEDKRSDSLYFENKISNPNTEKEKVDALEEDQNMESSDSENSDDDCQEKNDDRSASSSNDDHELEDEKSSQVQKVDEMDDPENRQKDRKEDSSDSENSDDEENDDDRSDNSSDDGREDRDDDDEDEDDGKGTTRATGASTEPENRELAADQHDKDETKDREPEKHENHQEDSRSRVNDKINTVSELDNKEKIGKAAAQQLPLVNLDSSESINESTSTTAETEDNKPSIEELHDMEVQELEDEKPSQVLKVDKMIDPGNRQKVQKEDSSDSENSDDEEKDDDRSDNSSDDGRDDRYDDDEDDGKGTTRATGASSALENQGFDADHHDEDRTKDRESEKHENHQEDSRSGVNTVSELDNKEKIGKAAAQQLPLVDLDSSESVKCAENTSTTAEAEENKSSIKDIHDMETNELEYEKPSQVVQEVDKMDDPKNCQKDQKKDSSDSENSDDEEKVDDWSDSSSDDGREDRDDDDEDEDDGKGTTRATGASTEPENRELAADQHCKDETKDREPEKHENHQEDSRSGVNTVSELNNKEKLGKAAAQQLPLVDLYLLESITESTSTTAETEKNKSTIEDLLDIEIDELKDEKPSQVVQKVGKMNDSQNHQKDQKKNSSYSENSDDEEKVDDRSDSLSGNDSEDRDDDDDDEKGATRATGASTEPENRELAADQHDEDETKDREPEKHENHQEDSRSRVDDKRNTVSELNEEENFGKAAPQQLRLVDLDSSESVAEIRIANVINAHIHILGSKQEIDDQSKMHPRLIENNDTSKDKSHQDKPSSLPTFGLPNTCSKDTEVCFNGDSLPLLEQLLNDGSFEPVKAAMVSKDLYSETEPVNHSHDFSSSSSNEYNVEPKPRYTTSTGERVDDVSKVGTTINGESNNGQNGTTSSKNSTVEPFVLKGIVQPEINNSEEIDNNNEMNAYKFYDTKQTENFTCNYVRPAFSEENDEKNSIIGNFSGNRDGHQLNSFNKYVPIEVTLGDSQSNQKQELRTMETGNSDSLSDKLNQSLGNHHMEMNSSSKSEACLKPLHNIVAGKVDAISESNSVRDSTINRSTEKHQEVDEDEMYAKHLEEMNQNPRSWKKSGFPKGVSEDYLVRKHTELIELSDVVIADFETQFEILKTSLTTDIDRAYGMSRGTISTLTAEEKMKSLSEIKTSSIEIAKSNLKTLWETTKDQFSSIWRNFMDTCFYYEGAEEAIENMKDEITYTNWMESRQENAIKELKEECDKCIKELTEEVLPLSSTNVTQQENENGSPHSLRNVNTLANEQASPEVNLENRFSNPQNSEQEAQNQQNTNYDEMDLWYNKHVSGENNINPTSTGSSTDSLELDIFSPVPEAFYQSFSSNESADNPGELQQQQQQLRNELQPSQGQQQQQQQQHIPQQQYQQMQPQIELGMRGVPDTAMQQEIQQRAIAANTAQEPIAPSPPRRKPGRPKKQRSDSSTPPSKRARPNSMEANQMYDPQFPTCWPQPPQNSQHPQQAQNVFAPPIRAPVNAHPANQNRIPSQQNYLQQQQQMAAMAANQLNHTQNSSHQQLLHAQNPLTHYSYPPQNLEAPNAHVMGHRLENSAGPSHGYPSQGMHFGPSGPMQHPMYREAERQLQIQQHQMMMQQQYLARNQGHPGAQPSNPNMHNNSPPAVPNLNYQPPHMQHTNNVPYAPWMQGIPNQMQKPPQAFQGGYHPVQHQMRRPQ